jgi:flagellar biosynthesis protein FlhB
LIVILDVNGEQIEAVQNIRTTIFIIFLTILYLQELVVLMLVILILILLVMFKRACWWQPLKMRKLGGRCGIMTISKARVQMV